MLRFTKMIPNIFTLGNLYCGFLSVGFAAHGEYKNAAILILIGMMLDSMDGRLARMLNVDSDLGKELIRCGYYYVWDRSFLFSVLYLFFSFGLMGLAVAGLFPLFGAFRLARFNISS